MNTTHDAKAIYQLEGDAIVVNLAWEASADLDLAALCVANDGRHATLVYYGNRGTRCEPPYAHLAMDHDGGGRRKLRREHLIVTNLDAHAKAYLFAWDHESIERGEQAAGDMGMRDWHLAVSDRHNQRIERRGAFTAGANLALVGVIANRTFESVVEEAHVVSRKQLLPTLEKMAREPVEIRT